MSAHSNVTTERLALTPVSQDDLEEVHTLHTNPEVWRHFISGRHGSRMTTATFISNVEQDWVSRGLGYWAVRLRDVQPVGVVGVAGCALRRGAVWNVYYRFAPAVWGRGLAAEAVTAARAAAMDLRPDLPVVAYLLAHNHGSKRTAERAGLDLVWSGPDVGNPDTDAVRLVYADRRLDRDVLALLVANS